MLAPDTRCFCVLLMLAFESHSFRKTIPFCFDHLCILCHLLAYIHRLSPSKHAMSGLVRRMMRLRATAFCEVRLRVKLEQKCIDWIVSAFTLDTQNCPIASRRHGEAEPAAGII